MYGKKMSPTQLEKMKRAQKLARYMDTRRIGEVFPDIESIEIEYHLQHISIFGKLEEDKIWNINLQGQMCFFIDCLNRECSSAGFDLKDEIYTMQREHITEKSDVIHCNGQEAPDHPEQRCGGSLKYTIKICYKRQ